MLYAVASGKAGFSRVERLRRQRLRAPLAAGYSLTAAIIIELLMTFAFVFVIHGVTHRRAPAGMAPLAIGLTLTLIHLVSIPVDNTSVNPARSLAPALFVGGWALSASSGCSSSSRSWAASSADSPTGTSSTRAERARTKAPASRG